MPSRDDDARIGPTAHYTAWVWSHLDLPYANLFATPRGGAMYWAFRSTLEWPAALAPGIPTLTQWLELRHRLLDHTLEDIGPDLIVEPGAGLSRRGVTWAADHGVRYVEMDLGHMVRAKRELLERRASAPLKARLDGLWSIEEADVTAPDFGTRLATAIRSARRPAVVLEGVLAYFDHQERARILRAIADALRQAGGGTLLCELHTSEARAQVPRVVQTVRIGIRLVTGRGTRSGYRNDQEVRDAFRDAGFTEADPVVPPSALVDGLSVLPGQVWRASV